MRRAIEIPTPEEDARINAGIAADPDNPEWTEADFGAAVRVRKMSADQLAGMAPSDVAAAEMRRRGPQKAPRKAQITMRIDHDVAEHLRGSGKGWQGRANNVLRLTVGPAKYAVEVYQPTGVKAELHEEFDDFHQALGWLDARMTEDRGRLPRLFSREPVLPEHHEALTVRRMVNGG